MKINYQILKDDNTLVCEGYTIHAFINISTREFTDIPGKARSIFEKYIEK